MSCIPRFQHDTFHAFPVWYSYTLKSYRDHDECASFFGSQTSKEISDLHERCLWVQNSYICDNPPIAVHDNCSSNGSWINNRTSILHVYPESTIIDIQPMNDVSIFCCHTQTQPYTAVKLTKTTSTPQAHYTCAANTTTTATATTTDTTIANANAFATYWIAPYGTFMTCFIGTALACVIPCSSPSSLKCTRTRASFPGNRFGISTTVAW